MTPFAQKILNDSCKPKARREFVDAGGFLTLMDEIHCFECSAVYETAKLLALDARKEIRAATINGPLMFLPSPKTWVEFKTELGTIGLLLIETADGFNMLASVDKPGNMFSSQSELRWRKSPLLAHPIEIHISPRDNNTPDDVTCLMRLLFNELIFILSMINTPRIIGRRTHMPHAGLQRKLAAARGMVGKFPLRAWTELKLEVRPPENHTGETDEILFTGGRALHFVRAHTRIRLGRLETVSSHWRGDPALGLCQTRYTVTPPRDGIWPKHLRPAE